MLKKLLMFVLIVPIYPVQTMITKCKPIAVLGVRAVLQPYHNGKIENFWKLWGDAFSEESQQASCIGSSRIQNIYTNSEGPVTLIRMILNGRAAHQGFINDMQNIEKLKDCDLTFAIRTYRHKNFITAYQKDSTGKTAFRYACEELVKYARCKNVLECNAMYEIVRDLSQNIVPRSNRHDGDQRELVKDAADVLRNIIFEAVQKEQCFSDQLFKLLRVPIKHVSSFLDTGTSLFNLHNQVDGLVYDHVLLENIVKKNHLSLLEIIIERNLHNNPDDKGYTLLHYAAREKNQCVVKRLIEAGVDIGVKDKDGNTVIDYVWQDKTCQLIKILLYAGIDPNSKSSGGSSLVHYTISMNANDLLQDLVAQGADLQLADENCHEFNISLLDLAIQNNNIDMVKFLIDRRVDFNWIDSEGSNSLMTAISQEDTSLEIVKLLLDAGVDIHYTFKDHHNVLHMAIFLNKIDVVKLLIKSGVNLRPHDRGVGYLNITIFKGETDRKEMLKVLLDEGIHNNFTKDDKLSVLETAIDRDKKEIVTILLERGIHNDFTKDDARVVLQFASRLDRTAIISVLNNYFKDQGICAFKIDENLLAWFSNGVSSERVPVSVLDASSILDTKPCFSPTHHRLQKKLKLRQRNPQFQRLEDTSSIASAALEGDVLYTNVVPYIPGGSTKKPKDVKQDSISENDQERSHEDNNEDSSQELRYELNLSDPFAQGVPGASIPGGYYQKTLYDKIDTPTSTSSPSASSGTAVASQSTVSHSKKSKRKKSLNKESVVSRPANKRSEQDSGEKIIDNYEEALKEERMWAPRLNEWLYFSDTQDITTCLAFIKQGYFDSIKASLISMYETRYNVNTETAYRKLIFDHMFPLQISDLVFKHGRKYVQQKNDQFIDCFYAPVLYFHQSGQGVKSKPEYYVVELALNATTKQLYHRFLRFIQSKEEFKNITQTTWKNMDTNEENIADLSQSQKVSSSFQHKYLNWLYTKYQVYDKGNYFHLTYENEEYYVFKSFVA